MTTVSPSILAEIQKSGLPREAQAFLCAISAGEVGSWGTFNTLYGETHSQPRQWTGSLDAFPDWPGDTAPGGSPTHAYGAFQFEPATYAGMANITGLVDVHPQSQIANAWVLGQHDFKKRTGGGDLLAALVGSRLDEVTAALQTTWEGGANSDFPARYAASLALLPSAPTSPPQPPADPIAAALAAHQAELDHASALNTAALARIDALISANGAAFDLTQILGKIGSLTSELKAANAAFADALAARGASAS